MPFDVLRDARLALRRLHRERGSALMVVAVLGLGIGVATMQFIVVNAFCLRGLPVPGVDRVLFIQSRDAQNRDRALSFRELEALLSGTNFAGVGGFANAPLVIGDEGRAPDRVTGSYVSATTFRVLEERPALGRPFELEDDRAGAAPVAMLSDRFWRSRYNSDPSIIGATIRINGAPATVIGVMARGFRFPSNTDVWVPLAAMPGLVGDGRPARSLSVIGRMKTGVTIAAARAELVTVGAQLALDHPETNRGSRITALPINERYNARITDPTWLAFIGVAVIVILIACANAASLLLLASIRRRHEMAVRTSIGVSRRRLVQQLLAEAVVLAAVAAALGTLLSLVGTRIVTSVIPENTLGYFTRFALDGRVLGVLSAVCLGTVFLCALLPALHASRSDVSQLMKEGGRGSTAGVATRRWTAGFLVTEFGLTMILLAALALGVRVARGTERITTVVDPDGITTASVTLPANRYPSADDRLTLYRALEARLNRVPEVASVAVATALPLAGGTPRRVNVDGRPLADPNAAPTAWTMGISPGYFDAMRLPLRRGRTFTDADGGPGSETVIINQRLASALFASGDAVGRRIRLTDPGASDTATVRWFTIVGVSPTVRQRPLAEPDFVAYLPLRSAAPPSAFVVARSRTTGSTLIPLLRDAARDLDGELPLYRARSLEQALLEAQWNARLTNTLMNVIALVALGMAMAGLYAVSAQAVLQRRREFGVRLALGARGPHLVGRVARGAAALLALGLAAGVAATWGFERLVGLGADAFGYRLSDLPTLAAAAAVLVTVTMIGCVGPAYRAARLDPAETLREQA